MRPLAVESSADDTASGRAPWRDPIGRPFESVATAVACVLVLLIAGAAHSMGGYGLGALCVPVLFLYAALAHPAPRACLALGGLATVAAVVAEWSRGWPVAPEAAVLAISTAVAAHVARVLGEERANLVRVTELVSAIPGTLDARSVMCMISETAALSVGGKAASVRLVSADGQSLEVRGTYGLSRGYLDKGKVLAKHSAIDRRVLSGETVAVLDAAKDPRFQYPDAARREGIASVLCVPLLLRGRPTGVLRVYAERPRRFTSREIRVLRTFAGVAAMAVEHAERHGEMLAYMRKTAHELRSPAAAVRSMLEILEQGIVGPVNEEQQQTLQRAMRRIDGLLEVVADVLSLSRLRMATVDAAAESVSLQGAVQRAVELWSARIEAKGVALQVSGADHPVRVSAVREHVDELVTNILSNAVKYTPSGGRVDIRIDERNGAAEIVVRDTGIGIPEDELPSIGTEFRRATNARASSEPGTGLGLSIVRSILGRYAGRLEIDSELGRGTEVAIYLPAERPDQRAALVAPGITHESFP